MNGMVRDVKAGDTKEVVSLMEQLGYLPSVDQIKQRLVSSAYPQRILVAELGGEVVGLLHMEIRSTLMDADFLEILSFITDSQHRSRGVGRHLLSAAIGWAKLHKLDKIKLYSNQQRTRAHQFYYGNGFYKVKDSVMLELKIPRSMCE